MMKIYHSDGPALTEFSPANGVDILAPVEESPDARIYLIDETNRLRAEVALWWSDTPVFEGKQIGTIGGFAATDAEAARQVLDSASSRLKAAGCRIAVGPMNGNTWRRHRFVIESDGFGSFLLEPRNSLQEPAWWRQAGFSVMSQYYSSVMHLDGTVALPAAVKERIARSNITVRSLDASRYDAELKRIHAVSLKCFSRNFLYTPLDEESFLDRYRKVRKLVDPDLVRIAERNGSICGFAFGIPDLEATARGEKPAVIVKTLAVDPDARCAGLGTLLVDELHRIGWEKGYTEAIHALQHETNTSLKITGRHQGVRFRSYALFSKTL